jgi:hypothetical protein
VGNNKILKIIKEKSEMGKKYKNIILKWKKFDRMKIKYFQNYLIDLNLSFNK